jgi:DNA-binding NtrC family response regulator
MQRDAYDYLVKPIDRTKLVTTIRNAVEKSDMEVRLVQLQREAEGQGYPNIVGEAPPMRELFRQLDRVAPSDVSVLIHGKSGTGKELVARALHANSGWREGPFVALNCAAIPETLQESELFGHEMGAFTGATSRKMGRFEEAHQGTLFLDEVAELSLSLQAKLLRVLQERVLRRLGGDGDIPSNFRLLAATHRDLAQEVKEGRFREDLFFRIAVFDLDVPSLSERKGDIPLLVEKFVSDFGGGRPIEMAPETMDILMGYDWPGNIRELQNAIQRAVVAGDLEFLRPADLPPRIIEQASAANRVSPPAVQGSESQNSQPQPSTTVPPSAGMTASPAKIRSLTELEKEAIEEAWRVTDGNLSEMARQLGLGRTTLYRKIKKYGID